MDRKRRRHRRIRAVLLALSLAGAQWLLGPAPGAVSPCGAGACLVAGGQDAQTAPGLH